LTFKAVIIDTNAVLRFITGDDIERWQKVSDLLDTSDCIVPVEVIAEAVYNLDKSYGHARKLIAEEIKDFISLREDLVSNENVVRYGCNVFATTGLDFIDCLLVGYANVTGNPIFSFDDCVNKKLEHLAYNQG